MFGCEKQEEENQSRVKEQREMRSVILAFAVREDLSEEANLSRNLNEMRGGLEKQCHGKSKSKHLTMGRS